MYTIYYHYNHIERKCKQLFSLLAIKKLESSKDSSFFRYKDTTVIVHIEYLYHIDANFPTHGKAKARVKWTEGFLAFEKRRLVCHK